MASPALRACVAADLAAVTAIYAHHVRFGRGSFEEEVPDLAEIERRHADVSAHGLPWLVAEADGRVLGYAYAAPYRLRSAYRFTVEDSVYIADDALGRGIGRLLLGRLIEECTALGCRQMLAVIGDSGNAGSIGLHAAFGFRDVGTLQSVGLKFGGWLDVVLMQRALGEGDETLPPAGS